MAPKSGRPRRGNPLPDSASQSSELSELRCNRRRTSRPRARRIRSALRNPTHRHPRARCNSPDFELYEPNPAIFSGGPSGLRTRSPDPLFHPVQRDPRADHPHATNSSFGRPRSRSCLCCEPRRPLHACAPLVLWPAISNSDASPRIPPPAVGMALAGLCANGASRNHTTIG